MKARSFTSPDLWSDLSLWAGLTTMLKKSEQEAHSFLTFAPHAVALACRRNRTGGVRSTKG